MSDLKPPNSIEAERAILGAVLLDNYAFTQTERLTVADFYLDSHRRIFSAMCQIAADNQPIDFVTLTDKLKDDLSKVGGVAYVTCLTDGLPRVKNIEQYVNIVIQKSRLRQLISLCTSTANEAYEDNYGGTDELISRTEKRLLEIDSSSVKHGPMKVCDILPMVNKDAAEQWSVSQEKSSVGYRTGIPEDDVMTSGYRKREVAVIGGYTSHGKSIYLKMGVTAQMVDNVPSLVFSREISKEQMVDDFKVQWSGLTGKARDKRKFDMFEREEYKKADEVIKAWPLWIDDDRGLHIDDLRRRAHRLIREEGIETIWVDYLGLINGSGNNATDRMEDVCAGIWSLADEEKVAVIVLAQLGRTGDKSKYPQRPKLSDFKQASRIEQDAHVVKFIYRPQGEDGKYSKNDELIIAKQRHGETGIIWVEFNRDKVWFDPRTVKYE